MQGKFDVVKSPGKLTGAQVATVLWDPAAGKRIELEFLRFTVSADCWVKLWKGADDGTPGNYLVNQLFKAGSGLSEEFKDRGFKFAADEVLKLTTDAGDIYPTLAGREL
jgi:hypothetical protein